MKKRKLNKVASLTIIICGLWYSLSKLTLPEHDRHLQISSSKKYMNNEATLATHLAMPSHVKGRKLPFHQVYESRQIGLPSDAQKIQNGPNIKKIILLWTPWNGIKNTINYYSLQLGNKSFVSNNCPIKNCVATRNRKHLNKADAVLFHLLDIKSEDLPVQRTLKQVWIMYNMEAPWLIEKHVYKELKHLKRVFNWTMTYREDSTIPVKYGYIEKSNAEPPVGRFPNTTRNVVWFVSDCNTESKREDYVNELRKYIDIDVYGKCGKYKCYPSQSSTCYEDVLRKYKFYLSFENSVCKDYVTEKFFNVFNYDVIPVALGGANYSAAAPADTFVDATKYPHPKALADALLDISENKENYRRILRNKRMFRSYLDPWMCRLCSNLHKNIQHSVLEDVEKWWMEDASCRSWNKSKFAFEETARKMRK